MVQRILFIIISILIAALTISNLNIKPIYAQKENLTVCNGEIAKLTYELSNSWIYICQENQELYYLQIDKTNPNQSLMLPASGSFYTYAAVDGELGNPETKIYNIGPLEFNLIQSSIIIETEKVIRAVDNISGTIITVLPENIETQAQTFCGKNALVSAFDTSKHWVYICINNTDDENDINLTYVQVSKSSPEEKITLPAQLGLDWGYKAQKNNISYKISPQGLEIKQNQQELNQETVNFVYLKAPNSHEIIRDN